MHTVSHTQLPRRWVCHAPPTPDALARAAARLQDMCSDLLQRCKTPVEQALKDAKLALSGGAAQQPLRLPPLPPTPPPRPPGVTATFPHLATPNPTAPGGFVV